ncbi:sigma-70 family RNA polymerase sigma factor [Bacillus sp. Marseille-Q3570]|uniref:sigma-70 family RNA polymerase sigma factor n=1 Tax=Bacillus sp. Marseille-Q3570 TaxID=2963522 RepID=UPI0021B740DC|nr:sigma-70 family RNA polymerase sigma factor [Bacillus sp. Marseille-Q3570]
MLSRMEFILKEPFEKVLENFDPLIKTMIRRYSYSLEFDESYQIGRIALWEAYERFDPDKGAFPAYAQRYLSGRFLQMLNRKCVTMIHAEERTLEDNYTFVVPYLDDLIVNDYLQNLSERERLYVDEIILKQGSMKELARIEGVSYETVRSWRKKALDKLRIKGTAMKKDK